ncbi:MAG: M28 family metallopeptidase [Candidatus Hadarchaeum sp.]|uniref:M28 family metallopeptidase n=1 Tax=Candidatus Hadarchaeum sp. TaxID=2883567 RepID=UPI003D0B921B
MKRVSPGANDNASGVAVMLEVARTISDSPPDEIEISFVAFGAEEQGLWGAKVFSKRATNSLVLNLDTLGVGHLCIVEGNGIMKKKATSSSMNQAVFKAAQLIGAELRPIWAIFASHDHIPLLSSSAGATTLTADTNEKKIFEKFLSLFGIKNAHLRRYKYIHGPEDLPDKIELVNLEMAGKLVLEFVKSVKEK